MKIHNHIRKRSRGEGGQIIALFMIFGVVLLLFVGLSIDLGFAYITKAQLSKAVDAASLAGISNYYQGETTAHDIAVSTFKANYEPNGKPARDVAEPTVTADFSLDAGSNRLISVTATATIRTFFIGYIPTWKTLAISDTGQATRSKLIMTLVLDRSGSMNPSSPPGTTHGGTYLPGAVQNFINVFDDNSDQAAVVTFASTVTNNLLMTGTFKTKVTDAVNYIANNNLWAGGTFAHGGLSNALAINNSIIVPTNADVVKVVVFFTDGLANVIQDTFTCSGLPQTYTYGGYDSGSPAAFWTTNTLITFSAQEDGYVCTFDGGCGQFAPPCCSGTTQFRSIDGTVHNFCRANITTEATNRCIQAANDMRTAGMYVYAIGLDTGNIDAPTADFLQNVANDPNGSRYDPTKPVGVAKIADNGGDLTQVFQQIASAILLRLTQ